MLDAQSPTASATTAATAATAPRTGANAPAPRVERDDVRARLGACVREDPLAQRGRRLGPRGGERQRGRRRPERLELLLALLALREMRLERVALGRVECVERVAGAQLVNSGFHDPSWVDSSRSSRNRASPANILLLIVPSGTPRRSASSDWEKPP